MTHPLPVVRSSKRKRAQVKYYDTDTDLDDIYDSDFLEDAPIGPRKKSKIGSTKTLTPRPLPKKKIFPFMLLPPELRNRIYEFTLTAPKKIILNTKTRHYRRTLVRQEPRFTSSTPQRWTLQPQILLVNKKINSEAQPVLYGLNHFYFEGSTDMHSFLASIGATNVASLTHLSLEGYIARSGGGRGYSSSGLMDYPAMVLLAPAHRLRVFEVWCSMTNRYGKSQRKKALSFYRMAYPWLDARAEDAVEALQLVEIDPLTQPRQIRPMKADDVKVFKDELRRLMKRR